MILIDPYRFGSGLVCPVYTTVTLQLLSTPYTPPVAPLIVLQLLPCPYTPAPV